MYWFWSLIVFIDGPVLWIAITNPNNSSSSLSAGLTALPIRHHRSWSSGLRLPDDFCGGWSCGNCTTIPQLLLWLSMRYLWPHLLTLFPLLFQGRFPYPDISAWRLQFKIPSVRCPSRWYRRSWCVRFGESHWVNLWVRNELPTIALIKVHPWANRSQRCLPVVYANGFEAITNMAVDCFGLLYVTNLRSTYVQWL